jgi:hypothetical protein
MRGDSVAVGIVENPKVFSLPYMSILQRLHSYVFLLNLHSFFIISSLFFNPSYTFLTQNSSMIESNKGAAGADRYRATRIHGADQLRLTITGAFLPLHRYFSPSKSRFPSSEPAFLFVFPHSLPKLLFQTYCLYLRLSFFTDSSFPLTLLFH